MSVFKKYSTAFWVSNSVELLERMAYYAVLFVLTLYLSNVYGFSDIEAGLISGIFSPGYICYPLFRELWPTVWDSVYLCFWLSFCLR